MFFSPSLLRKSFFFGIDLRRRRRRHNKETGNGGLTTRLNADVGASLLISIEIGECVEYFVAVVVFGWNSRRVASHGGTFEFGVWCFFFFSFLFFFVILGFCSSVHRVPPEIRWVSRFQIGNFFVRGVFVFFLTWTERPRRPRVRTRTKSKEIGWRRRRSRDAGGANRRSATDHVTSRPEGTRERGDHVTTRATAEQSNRRFPNRSRDRNPMVRRHTHTRTHTHTDSHTRGYTHGHTYNGEDERERRDAADASQQMRPGPALPKTTTE